MAYKILIDYKQYKAGDIITDEALIESLKLYTTPQIEKVQEIQEAPKVAPEPKKAKKPKTFLTRKRK